jgi:hypothetical protein
VRIVLSEARHTVRCDLLYERDHAYFKHRFPPLGAAQALNNQSALHNTDTAAQLKAILKQLVDDCDRIVVTEIGAEWASRRALANLGKM